VFRFSFAVIACAALMLTSVGCGGGGSQTSDDLGPAPTTTEEMEKRMNEMKDPNYDKMKQMSGPTRPGQTAPPAGK
jgi:hypothetical protein